MAPRTGTNFRSGNSTHLNEPRIKKPCKETGWDWEITFFNVKGEIIKIEKISGQMDFRYIIRKIEKMKEEINAK